MRTGGIRHEAERLVVLRRVLSTAALLVLTTLSTAVSPPVAYAAASGPTAGAATQPSVLPSQSPATQVALVLLLVTSGMWLLVAARHREKPLCF